MNNALLNRMCSITVMWMESHLDPDGFDAFIHGRPGLCQGYDVQRVHSRLAAQNIHLVWNKDLHHRHAGLHQISKAKFRTTEGIKCMKDKQIMMIVSCGRSCCNYQEDMDAQQICQRRRLSCRASGSCPSSEHSLDTCRHLRGAFRLPETGMPACRCRVQ